MGSASVSGGASVMRRVFCPPSPRNAVSWGPVCFCVVGRDGPSFLPPGLSLYLLLFGSGGAKCHGSGSERKEEKGVGLQAGGWRGGGGGLFTLLCVTLRWLVS